MGEVTVVSWMFDMMGPFFCGLISGGVLGFLLGVILGGFTILGAWASIAKKIGK